MGVRTQKYTEDKGCLLWLLRKINRMGFWIVEAVASFIECFISSLFIGDVLGVEKRKYKESILWGIIVVAGLLLINRIQLFSALATVYGIIALTVYGYFLYRGNVWDILVVVVSYFLLLYLIDFSIVLLIGVLFNKYDLGANIISEQSWTRVFLLIIVKVTLILLYILFHKIFQKIEIMSRKILIGIVAALGLMLDLERRLCERIESDVVGNGILLLCIVAMSIYLMLQYTKMKKQKLQTELTQERNFVMMKGYEEMMQNYRSNAIYYHDLKNHMLTLERYLINGEYDKAISYMETLQMDRVEVSAHRWTGIEIIDFILNHKKEMAEKKGISFVIDADLLKLHGMEETDLCALFGNLLDNAIEGCERERGEKEIHISIRMIREMLVIKAVNTCRSELPHRDGFFMTEKKDKSRHGWGMKSMQMITEKYGGTMQCDCRNGEFGVVMTFFF